jgi:hypothetical protein
VLPKQTRSQQTSNNVNEGGKSRPDLDQIEGLEMIAKKNMQANNAWVILYRENAKQVATTFGLGGHVMIRIETTLQKGALLKMTPAPGIP